MTKFLFTENRKYVIIKAVIFKLFYKLKINNIIISGIIQLQELILMIFVIWLERR